MTDHSSLAGKATLFRELHHAPEILVLPNVWDVATGKLVEAAGFRAIATSSAGVANALGYPDGQRISRAEMLAVVERIARATHLPVSADLEAGYGSGPANAAELARELILAGAVGLNLEDATGNPARPFKEISEQVAEIRAIREAGERAGVPLVINARTDAFGVGDLADAQRAEEAIRRANAYLRAGADCAFVPFVADRAVIARLAGEIQGPLNVLGTPDSPPVAELERLGVRRISIGGGLARAAYGRARRVAIEVRETGTFQSLREGTISYAEMQRLLSG